MHLRPGDTTFRYASSSWDSLSLGTSAAEHTVGDCAWSWIVDEILQEADPVVGSVLRGQASLIIRTRLSASSEAVEWYLSVVSSWTSFSTLGGAGRSCWEGHAIDSRAGGWRWLDDQSTGSVCRSQKDGREEHSEDGVSSTWNGVMGGCVRVHSSDSASHLYGFTAKRRSFFANARHEVSAWRNPRALCFLGRFGWHE